MIKKKEFYDCQKFLKVSALERWSLGVLKKCFKPFVITPILQHPNIPKLIEMPRPEILFFVFLAPFCGHIKSNSARR
ncbi:MAG: hypothetical protein QNJ58_27370 [Desulfobacterales bacterium]|nr:hypothetical protein [Desulfobacterales bacterium]